MLEMLQDTELWLLLLLFAIGVVAFIVSTIAGGGGALLLVPVLNFLIGTPATAPVLNLGSFIGRPVRLFLFWKHINWRVFWYYVPAALLGAWIAGWIFSEVKVAWLQLFVGLFLISTVFQFRFGKKQRSFPMRLWYFIPLGFGVSVLGTIIGALGPILNPFYLNIGLEKEDLIATKTANSFFMGMAQIGSYSFFGLLNERLWVYGIVLGLGAALGNVIGKRFLKHMKNTTFRKWLLALMVVSGVVMLSRYFLSP